MPSAKRPIPAPTAKQLYDLRACYTGSMLGLTFNATMFRTYARTYAVHRRRMQECLAELGANVVLPTRWAQFVAKHDALLEVMQSEMARVSPTYLGWMLFGATLLDFAVRQAFRKPEARNLRRSLAFFLDKLRLPRTLLSDFKRRCHLEKDSTLSTRALHTAALCVLNEVIGNMKRDPRAAFVAMPFSVPHMATYYADLYLPVLKTLGLKPLRAWGGFGTEEYQELLYTLIDRCGAMLADITTLKPNVMHEVGYALGTRNKFVILLAEKGHPVPANLGDLTVLRYGATGHRWQVRAVREIATAVALFQYTAQTALPGSKTLRLVGPMKVTA